MPHTVSACGTEWIRALVLAVGVLWGGNTAFATEILVAAAADLNFAMKDIVAEFEQKTGHRVKLSLGSSGNFMMQISNGAPFDLYFSADIRYPQKLVESGRGVPGSLYQYAVGRIVVWARKQSPLAVESRGMEVLLDPSIRRIAIANATHAPYGRAAEAALKHFRIYESVRDKLVLGENISQAAQFVESGAAEVGIIALSLALAPTMAEAGRHWMVPAEAHPPIEQGVVLLKNGSNQEAARAFLEFVKGADGRAIMRRYGFVVPGDKAP